MASRLYGKATAVLDGKVAGVSGEARVNASVLGAYAPRETVKAPLTGVKVAIGLSVPETWRAATITAAKVNCAVWNCPASSCNRTMISLLFSAFLVALIITLGLLHARNENVFENAELIGACAKV